MSFGKRRRYREAEKQRIERDGKCSSVSGHDDSHLDELIRSGERVRAGRRGESMIGGSTSSSISGSDNPCLDDSIGSRKRGRAGS